jgi:hypothetical protein
MAWKELDWRGRLKADPIVRGCWILCDEVAGVAPFAVEGIIYVIGPLPCAGASIVKSILRQWTGNCDVCRVDVECRVCDESAARPWRY